MNDDLRTALRLQEFDLRIRDLQDEIARLPKQIAEIEQQLSGHIRQWEREKATLAANLKTRKQLEGDAAVHQQKISKLRDQMLQAKTNEQYRAFQNEIAYAEGEIRKCEDRILDLMAEAETLERNVRAAEHTLAAEKKQVEAQKESALSRTAADKKELTELQTLRQSAASQLAKPVLDLYERLRSKSRNGLAIVEVKRDLCTGCRMALRPQLLLDVRTGDKLVQCENCRLILFISEAPVDVAQEMNN